jgi:hypothetical protein
MCLFGDANGFHHTLFGHYSNDVDALSILLDGACSHNLAIVLSGHLTCGLLQRDGFDAHGEKQQRKHQ